MKILVINCGSSSLKYQVINMEGEVLMAKGLVERIGMDGSCITHEKIGEDKVKKEVPMETHKEAIAQVLDAIVDPEHGVLKDMAELGAVGHRVVHAGEKYAHSVIIDDDVIKALEECVPLAPLHNPPNLLGIAACRELMPETPMVGVFDTAFHQTMPPESYIYAIPYEYYEKHGIRRYGFHGTSHKYVAERAADIMNCNLDDLKLITCHLGNGASITAIKNGKCINTSMGLTPLGGIMMGTRCGNIDPAIIPYLQNTTGMTADEIDYIMNNKSGLLGLSGVSSDLRDVEAAAAAGNYRAQIALDLFVYTAATYIAAVTVSLGGLDAIIFTAGIGENDPGMRKMICDRLKHFGVEIDDKINNEVRRRECSIASLDSKIGIFVIPTNEELIVARDTYKLIRSLKGDDLDD